MENYLFKISLKPDGVWSRYHGQAVKPMYFVAHNKEEARKWADDNLTDGLAVRSISMMARQLAPHVYTGTIK